MIINVLVRNLPGFLQTILNVNKKAELIDVGDTYLPFDRYR